MARPPQLKQKASASQGFAAKSPLFPAVASMETDLGHTNQFILINELAMRELNTQSLSNGDGVEQYMKSVSKKHAIRVSLSQFNEVVSELPRWYTMLVFTAVDRAFRQLIREIWTYKCPSNWIRRVNDEELSAIQQLELNQPPGSVRLNAYPEYAVMEYYRLIRNEFVHTPRQRNRPTIEAHTALMEKSGDYLKERYQTRGAPNAPDSLTFDDFFLQTRVARDFAIVISDAYQLTIDDIFRVASIDHKLLRRAKATGGHERFRNCYYDYYLKRHMRWNDKTADHHAKNFADLALRLLR